ncbi:hypothetical protein [Streptomyces sp. sk2.1]|uniref:hypothetical protein n=1 Tax=Streptomyces sp. sk2.1 TaxID=2478959 RepID=UPI0011E77D45|nr:hypothetical protein [Streptomyces sp. sk2.1]TXS71565.1 hypothetical protein EAO76_20880 [Streptomyces sp. sk2.1]
MRRLLRYLLLVAGAGLAVLVMAAVHAAAVLPFAAAVYADVSVGLCWLVVAVLFLRRRDTTDVPGDTSGPRHHRAVRCSTDGEPLARPHRGTRHRH